MALTDNKLVDTQEKEAEVIDIDLSPIQKKRFRINGDPNKVIYLNTSDMNIVSRLSKVYPKLQKLAEEATSFTEEELEDNSSEGLEKFAKKMETIDAKMRKYVDELFDAEVSEACVDGGTMYDPFGGMFRFEHIISTLAKLYENNFSQEFGAMKARMKKHTDKYIK